MEQFNSGQNFSVSNIAMEFLIGNKDNNCYSYSLDGHLQNGKQPCNMPSNNLFFHNISKGKNSGEVPFMIPGNVKKKFENFTRYINSKEHNLLKETMHQLNEISSHYSDFLTSPRGYSDVSNSIASYLIGGFVGSKSQMNNEKHKLSYDLGGAIFKILQDFKCDKSYDKLREEKKFDTNRLGKKQKSRDTERFYQDVLYKNIINKSDVNETEPISKTSDCLHENYISTSMSTEMGNENHEIFPELVTNQVKCDVKITLTAANKNCEEKTKVNADNLCSNASLNDNKTQIDVSADNQEKSLPCDYKDGLRQSISVQNDEKSEPVILNSVAHVSCWSLGIRGRHFSECSVESTDSDSFIVFNDPCCIEYQSSVLSESENDEIVYFGEGDENDDSDDDDDYNDDNDDDDECCWIENLDDYDNGVEDREVAEANARWSEMYKDVEKDVDSSRGRVRFKDEVTIHRMVAWDYAYRAARPGPWEQMAHDRGRFRERIQRVSSVISPVLDEFHRKSVYNKLYA